MQRRAEFAEVHKLSYPILWLPILVVAEIKYGWIGGETEFLFHDKHVFFICSKRWKIFAQTTYYLKTIDGTTIVVTNVFWQYLNHFLTCLGMTCHVKLYYLWIQFSKFSEIKRYSSGQAITICNYTWHVLTCTWKIALNGLVR